MAETGATRNYNFIDAVHVLTLGVPAGTPTVPTEHPVLLWLGLLVAIVAVFAPLARAYGRRS